MRVRPWLLVGALAAVAALAWWLLPRAGDGAAGPRTARRSGAVERSRPGGGPGVTGVRVRPALIPPGAGAQVDPAGLDRAGAGAEPAAARVAFDARRRHSADPCTAPFAPSIPSGYRRATVGGVTVAWADADPAAATDWPLRPVAIAHLVAGLLDEAATLTETEPRAQLTVVIDASPDQFLEQTGAPRWVAGLYDGGVVRLARDGGGDLGVSLPTLRHEVMHAQLHVAVGCAPFWFDEGMAQYFGDPPPVGAWLAIAGGRDPIDLASVDDPALSDLTADEARHHYAVAFAMIVAALDGGGPVALRGVVRAARAVDSPGAAAALWSQLYPGVDGREVAERLARRLFDPPSGTDLDDVLAGAICCSGVYDVDRLACRGAPTRSRSVWIDASATPSAVCRNRW